MGKKSAWECGRMKVGGTGSLLELEQQRKKHLLSRGRESSGKRFLKGETGSGGGDARSEKQSSRDAGTCERVNKSGWVEKVGEGK